MVQVSHLELYCTYRVGGCCGAGVFLSSCLLAADSSSSSPKVVVCCSCSSSCHHVKKLLANTGLSTIPVIL